MNIKYLSKLSERYPYLARGAELAVISGAIYIAGAVIAGEVLNQQALYAAIATPILAGLSKLKRDLEK